MYFVFLSGVGESEKKEELIRFVRLNRLRDYEKRSRRRVVAGSKFYAALQRLKSLVHYPFVASQGVQRFRPFPGSFLNSATAERHLIHRSLASSVLSNSPPRPPSPSSEEVELCHPFCS